MFYRNAMGSLKETDPSQKQISGNQSNRRKSSKKDLWDYEENLITESDMDDFYDLDYEDDNDYFI
ncbi:MAG: hypothetical protein ABF321_08305 [Bacteroidia bacterium]|jgi:hypothetical protein